MLELRTVSSWCSPAVSSSAVLLPDALLCFPSPEVELTGYLDEMEGGVSK